ncbi:MAG: hypothetical protein RSA84_20530 [Acinetobacter sp.]
MKKTKMKMSKLKQNTPVIVTAFSLLAVTTQAPAICHAEYVKHFIGTSLPTLDSPNYQQALDNIRRLSEANQVRAIGPDGKATREWLSDAAWVFYDNANKIIKIECGH